MLRLYRACADDLTQRDWLVDLTHEVNTLATADATVAGYARDALSPSRIVPRVPHVLCRGAGGAGTALLLALHHLDTGAGPAARLVFADTNPLALDDLRAVVTRARIDPAAVLLVHVNDPEDCDALLERLPTPALVINATGLGKDAPGSPVTDRAPFGPAIVSWDFNYRGTLTFLHQAATHGARTVDGWDYFVAGWACGLTAIAGTSLTSDLLTKFGQVAAPYRPGEQL